MENPQDTIDEMQEMLESVGMEEVVLACASDRDLKKEIHNLLIQHVKDKADSGYKFKITKRQYGLMVVLEGLIILSAARESEAEQSGYAHN